MKIFYFFLFSLIISNLQADFSERVISEEIFHAFDVVAEKHEISFPSYFDSQNKKYDFVKLLKDNELQDNVKEIYFGLSGFCILYNQGEGNCYGNNALGQLDFLKKNTEKIEEFALGSKHGCLLNKQGNFVCSGDNKFGQSSNPFNDQKKGMIKRIFARGNMTAVSTVNGEFFVWGEGVGKDPLKIENITDLTLGEKHWCGKTAEGIPICGGDNSHGQLNAPKRLFSFIEKIETISAGAYHNCAITKENKKWKCWGNRFEKVNIPNSFNQNIVLIASGRDHSCAKNQKGEYLCLGPSNSNNQIPEHLKNVQSFSLGMDFNAAKDEKDNWVFWGNSRPYHDYDKKWFQKNIGRLQSGNASFELSSSGIRVIESLLTYYFSSQTSDQVFDYQNLKVWLEDLIYKKMVSFNQCRALLSESVLSSDDSLFTCLSLGQRMDGELSQVLEYFMRLPSKNLHRDIQAIDMSGVQGKKELKQLWNDHSSSLEGSNVLISKRVNKFLHFVYYYLNHNQEDGLKDPADIIFISEKISHFISDKKNEFLKFVAKIYQGTYDFSFLRSLQDQTLRRILVLNYFDQDNITHELEEIIIFHNFLLDKDKEFLKEFKQKVAQSNISVEFHGNFIDCITSPEVHDVFFRYHLCSKSFKEKYSYSDDELQAVDEHILKNERNTMISKLNENEGFYFKSVFKLQPQLQSLLKGRHQLSALFFNKLFLQTYVTKQLARKLSFNAGQNNIKYFKKHFPDMENFIEDIEYHHYDYIRSHLHNQLSMTPERRSPVLANNLEPIETASDENNLCVICFDENSVHTLEGHDSKICLDCLKSHLRRDSKERAQETFVCPLQNCHPNDDHRLNVIQYLALDPIRALLQDIRSLHKIFDSLSEVNPDSKWLYCSGGCGYRYQYKSNEAHQQCPLCSKILNPGLNEDEQMKLRYYMEHPNLKWKHCPQCREIIEKNEGCDHMHCSKCDHKFNWSEASEVN